MLHTGASHSIINSTIAKEKYDPLVEVSEFRSTTGEECAIKGKAIRNISISDVSMKHEFLVADIMNEVILGIDFMTKHGFVLDMEKQVLQYANVTLPLSVGYDIQAEMLQVVVQREQKIPPNSKPIVWATGTRELKLSKTWVVGSTKECTKDNIIIGKAVVSLVNNLIPMWVLACNCRPYRANESVTITVKKQGDTIPVMRSPDFALSVF
uniref:Peptidase A2 domain-containing protein n=1 Tax=Glossina pallidipes TaxID=7398 RepID=A0A1A9ZWQ2_GLOPL